MLIRRFSKRATDYPHTSSFITKNDFINLSVTKRPGRLYPGFEIVQPTGSGAQKIMSHIVKSEEKHSGKVHEAVLQ